MLGDLGDLLGLRRQSATNDGEVVECEPHARVLLERLAGGLERRSSTRRRGAPRGPRARGDSPETRRTPHRPGPRRRRRRPALLADDPAPERVVEIDDEAARRRARRRPRARRPSRGRAAAARRRRTAGASTYQSRGSNQRCLPMRAASRSQSTSSTVDPAAAPSRAFSSRTSDEPAPGKPQREMAERRVDRGRRTRAGRRGRRRWRPIASQRRRQRASSAVEVGLGIVGELREVEVGRRRRDQHVGRRERGERRSGRREPPARAGRTAPRRARVDPKRPTGELQMIDELGRLVAAQQPGESCLAPPGGFQPARMPTLQHPAGEVPGTRVGAVEQRTLEQPPRLVVALLADRARVRSPDAGRVPPVRCDSSQLP